MAFNNLWICKYDENVSYNEIKNNLNSNNYFIENSGYNYLKHKIDIIDEYNSKSLNFIYGKYGYEYETNATYPKITSERIIDEGDLIVKTSVISFWITDNHIILFSLKEKKKKNKFAENILNGISSIRNININIAKIHEAVHEGKFGDMWLVSEDRNNNVNRGSLFGVNVNDDPIYPETENATQNFVGIMKDVGDEKIKIKLVRDGGIQIYGKLLNPLDVLPFNIIDDLKEYFD